MKNHLRNRVSIKARQRRISEGLRLSWKSRKQTHEATVMKPSAIGNYLVIVPSNWCREWVVHSFSAAWRWRSCTGPFATRNEAVKHRQGMLRHHKRLAKERAAKRWKAKATP